VQQTQLNLSEAHKQELEAVRRLLQEDMAMKLKEVDASYLSQKKVD